MDVPNVANDIDLEGGGKATWYRCGYHGTLVQLAPGYIRTDVGHREIMNRAMAGSLGVNVSASGALSDCDPGGHRIPESLTYTLTLPKIRREHLQLANRDDWPITMTTNDHDGVRLVIWNGKLLVHKEAAWYWDLDSVQAELDSYRRVHGSVHAVELVALVEEAYGCHGFLIEFDDGTALSSVMLGRAELPTITSKLFIAAVDLWRRGFTLDDLCPDNIILSRDGSLKIIDLQQGVYLIEYCELS